MPHMDKRKEETKISLGIKKYLESRGWIVIRVNSGGYRGRMRGAPAGTPDLIACCPYDGRFTVIEVKVPGELPTEAQSAWLSNAARFGAYATYLTSTEGAVNYDEEIRKQCIARTENYVQKLLSVG